MIRRLLPGDGALFREIRLEALRAEPAAYASRAADWEALPDAEWERRLAANPVFVDLEGDAPVGLIGLVAQAPSRMAHRATVVMAYVRAANRREGRGAALLRAAAAHAEALGLRQLELAVSAANPGAQRLYARLGFAPMGRIPGGYLDQGRETDEILMFLRLPLAE